MAVMHLDTKSDAQGKELRGAIDALGAKSDAKFDAQGAKIDAKFDALINEMRSLLDNVSTVKGAIGVLDRDVGVLLHKAVPQEQPAAAQKQPAAAPPPGGA